MYKLLLCWRYLKTRYLAMACIISVMLGVATLIVVNSVMSGFSTKLRDKLHTLLSDVVIESMGMEGFDDPKGKMAAIRKHPFLGPRIQALTATLEVFAMLQFEWPNGEPVTRPVRLIGVDPKERSLVGDFKELLVNKANKKNPSFDLPEEAKKRFNFLEEKGKQRLQQLDELNRKGKPDLPADPGEIPPPAPTPDMVKIPQGVFLGNLIASFRKKGNDPEHPEKKYDDVYLLQPGDTVILTTVGGQKLAPVYDRFVVADFFKSEMSEYDNNYVFVSLEYLQHLRTMQDRVTSIQIKLVNYDRDAMEVVEKLKALFPHGAMRVNTWEEKQGALLAAINVEKGILNILLFLIIAVAGFGILAIFSMIVAEKTRDIGILKALGAPSGGVMRIFLGYGLLLGMVGAGFGTTLGILLTTYINEVEAFLARLTGSYIFNPEIYYFDKIPTDLQLSMLLLVNLGAVGMAVLFSVLPALRAALLHPVRALRYE